MPQFAYQPFDPSGLVQSIASLIARQGDPYAQAAQNIAASNARAMDSTAQANARAREVSGDVWGRAITNLGQLPNQIMAQQRENANADQMRKLRQSEIEQNAIKTQQQQRSQQGEQLLGSLIQKHTTVDDLGTRTIDHQAIASDLSAAGYPDAAEGWLKTSASNAESLEKLKGLKRQTAETIATAVGKAANSAQNPGDLLTSLGHLHVEDPDTFDQNTIGQITQQLQQAGPDGFAAVKKSLIDRASAIAKPITLKKDESLLDPITQKPIYSAPGKLTNESEIAMAAADPNHPQHAQAVTAMDLQRAQKNPPSLEEQYLKAKAEGKTDAANLILGTWKDQAAAKRDPVASAQLEAIRNISVDAARARLDDMTPTSDKNQQKFEQEYRTVLQRGLSSRSGGLGLEDAKVQQANHLIALLDQNFDPKTGEWNIPRVQLNELALGLARLTSPGGQAGEGMLKEFQQRTAKGDVAGALTYLTGEPVPANTQAITKYLKESIERQGQTAEQNREGEMRYLRGLAPTDLNEARRTALEANSLNPLRQSRIIQNKDSGERKLQTSTDGGKTWK